MLNSLAYTFTSSVGYFVKKAVVTVVVATRCKRESMSVNCAGSRLHKTLQEWNMAQKA